MNFDQENSVRFVKTKFFLKFIFILMLIVGFNFFVKISIEPSNYYIVKQLNNTFYGNTPPLSSNKTILIKGKLFSISEKDFSYSIIYDSIIGASEHLYVLLRSKNNYAVYSIKTNKLLFSFNTNGFVFVLNDSVFSMNEFYKTLEGYDLSGNKTLSLNFLSSILDIEYLNGILALGLASGQVYVYRYGTLIYIDNPSDIDELVYAVKLSPNYKYLGIIRGKDKALLKIIDLDNNYQTTYCLYNLEIYGSRPFIEIDNNLNIFLKTKKTLMILNLNSKKVFNIKNDDKILKISYDLNNRTYKIYFYDELHNIINIRVYLNGSFKLEDNIFVKDKVIAYADFNKGILYLNEKSNLCYLGINL